MLIVCEWVPAGYHHGMRARAVRGLPHRRRHWRAGIIYKFSETGGRRIRTTYGIQMPGNKSGRTGN